MICHIGNVMKTPAVDPFFSKVTADWVLLGFAKMDSNTYFYVQMF